MAVTNLRDFQTKVHQYRQLTGKPQKELAEAVGIHPNVLSSKLNGTGRTGLNHPEIKKIIQTLVEWGAITRQAEALELLGLMNLKATAFSTDEWNSLPLNQLRQTAPASYSGLDGDVPAISFTGFDKSEPSGKAVSLSNFPQLEKALRDVRFNREDWGDAPDLTSFCGREKELSEVGRWLVKERCRVVTVLGMGGIGKTVFATRLGEEIKSQFDFVLWRSLQYAPPLDEFLTECIYLLSGQPQNELPPSTDRRLALLLSWLRKYRCLLILDKAESLLEWGYHLGQYRPGYEGYGRLFQALGENNHQSCLLLTSQENLKELIPVEGKNQQARAFQLKGLELIECQELLKAKELFGTQEAWAELIRRYSGHPLALKLIAEPIHALFDGDIAAFLHEGEIIFGDLRKLLDLQFARLSALEQEIMFRLATEYVPVTLVGLLAMRLPSAATRQEVVEAMIALWRRSMLEREEEGAYFRLPSIMLEYMRERLIKQVCEEVVNGKPALLLNQPLFQAQAKSSVQDYQIRLIIRPLLARLLSVFKSEPAVEKQLSQLLARYKEKSRNEQGYLGDNLNQLLSQLHQD